MSVLETNRLILREYSFDDSKELFAILSDSRTMSFWPAPSSRFQAEEWLQRNLTRYREWGFGRWGIVLKETNRLIGDCGIVIAEIDGQLEHDLGYILHHPYWQQGLAYEAAQACKDYAFRELKMTRLCANMPYNHEGSRKIAEKIGMMKEREFNNPKNRNILTYLYAIQQ